MPLRVATIRANLVVSDPASAGVNINHVTGAALKQSVVHDCALRGIGDFDGAVGTKLQWLVVAGNGHDGQPYNGDGILLQGQGTEVGWCVISGNGDNDNYEHGIYVAGQARNIWVHDCLLSGNAASGIKAGGGGLIEHCTISGSPRGVVFDGDQPADMTVRSCRISASDYAIQVDANTRLARYHSDYNIYDAAARFSLKGNVLDLAGWRAATGLDMHSVAVAS